jgi:hypothetical protein
VRFSRKSRSLTSRLSRRILGADIPTSGDSSHVDIQVGSTFRIARPSAEPSGQGLFRAVD